MLVSPLSCLPFPELNLRSQLIRSQIHPNLGVAEIDGEEIVLADIPGLKWRSYRCWIRNSLFRTHRKMPRTSSRTDATEPDPWQNYKTVRSELEQYGAGLESKIEIIALNKCDALTHDP